MGQLVITLRIVIVFCYDWNAEFRHGTLGVTIPTSETWSVFLVILRLSWRALGIDIRLRAFEVLFVTAFWTGILGSFRTGQSDHETNSIWIRRAGQLAWLLGSVYKVQKSRVSIDRKASLGSSKYKYLIVLMYYSTNHNGQRFVCVAP